MKHQERNRRLSRRYLLQATFATVGALALTGCGSSGVRNPGSALSSSGRGSISFHVKWPAQSRFIPASSQSIKFTVSSEAAGQNLIAGVVVNRPSASATLTNIPAGTEYVTAAAYPEPNGQGVPQASATGKVYVQPGQDSPITLTLNSTISVIEIAQTAGPGMTSLPTVGTTFTVPTGSAHSIGLLATARDASGDIVLTDSRNGSNIYWTVDNPAVASVTPGPSATATITGLVPGTALVTASYKENGAIVKFATVTINVVKYVPTFIATTGQMTAARAENTATLLPTGKVLIAGQSYGEIYDPATGLFSATGALASIRTKHTATLLSDGTVLLTGGDSSAVAPGAVQPVGTSPLATAEIYNSATGAFTVTAGAMTTPREYQTATLLKNGRVLVVGGWDGTRVLNTAEIYDPTSRTFTAVSGTLSSPRMKHTATLLPNGDVLIAGGDSGSGPLATAELFDPSLNSGAGGFVPGAIPMSIARESQTATLLTSGPNSGKVLIAGGSVAANGNVAELYDPTSNSFTPITGSPMSSNRLGATATLLSGSLAGDVLIAGGRTADGGTILDTAEIFDPVAGTFTPTADPLTTPRQLQAAVLLPNGLVLLAGGSNGTANLSSAETTSSATKLTSG